MNFRCKVAWLWLLVPIGLFTLLRLPPLLHQAGGQDEQLFAVPGYTVWKEGIPRIPFFPARERSSLFENSDRCLLALPPGLFYVQAPFFALFPAGYPTARLPSFLASFVAIAMTYALAKQFGSSSFYALFAALLFSLSRPLMFTGMIARPDLLCVVCGIGAIILCYQASEKSRGSWIAIGTLCGLAGLFHPFALVFAIQVAAMAVFTPGSLQTRLYRLALTGFFSLAILALWLPLIIRFPYEFRTQFFSNVLDRAGPGLTGRLLWPLPSFIHHSRLIWEFLGPFQLVMMIVGLLAGSMLVLKSSAEKKNWKLLGLIWSSVYLTATVAGIHPTKGYWVYPMIMILALMAMAMSTVPLPRSFQLLTVAVAIFAMLPGAGLKTSWAYLRHWGEPEYHASSFIKNVLEKFPKSGLYLSDISYVFDIYLSGRDTVLCKDKVDYGEKINLDYDFIFLAWEGKDAGWADSYNATLMNQEGSREPKQACYVDIFSKAKAP